MRGLNDGNAAGERFEDKDSLGLLIGGGNGEDVDGIEERKFAGQIDLAHI